MLSNSSDELISKISSKKDQAISISMVSILFSMLFKKRKKISRKVI